MVMFFCFPFGALLPFWRTASGLINMKKEKQKKFAKIPSFLLIENEIH
jgi:hypothetical protein